MAELRFIETVAERARVAEDQAASLTEATLRTLTERITAGEADDLPARLPDQFRPLLIKFTEPAQGFPYEEFIARVAQRAGVEHDIAERGVRAVLQTMHPLVGDREFDEVMAQLPHQFRELVQTAPQQPAPRRR
ncbi:DUF2267 domain-containing protein [Planosporangium mesophilum]|uniref:DUF2267 domain-containing protein n=1 Tax=Planosporangium mesophilum TaxID=689768 RepID=A0A8J3TIA7_9ACTN|nr:DUF2267 domain-containing protein [Planosporangium mesophilum]NJC86712.1 DUF2267 domain-containing protein [Planosporangium mesophilum]GII25662.1 hypothetical protein Pme01_52590 [Planosporangium mesophilum]